MDIFEYLREKLNCAHISDLKFGIYKIEAIKILKQMDLSMINQNQIADISAYLGIALA